MTNRVEAPSPSGPRIAAFPVAPPRARKAMATWKRGLIYGSAAGLVLAGVGILVPLSRGHFEPRIPLAQLPPTISTLVGGQPRGELPPADAVDRIAIASTLAAEMCGGIDLVAALESARGRDYATVAALGLERLSGDPTLGAAVRCGLVFAEAAGSSPIIRIAFDDGPKRRTVVALEHGADIPAITGFADVNFSDHLGRCTPPASLADKVNGTTCSSTGWAGLDLGKLWYGGSFEAIRAFASAFGKTTEESDAIRVLSKVAAHLSPAATWELKYHPKSVDLSLPCVVVAPAEAVGDFVSNCLPTGHEADGAALAVGIDAVGMGRASLAEKERVRFEYVFEAHDDAAASAAESKLRAYVDAWSATLNTNESALRRIASSSKAPQSAPWAAVTRSWLAAAKNAKIERTHTLVTLRLEQTIADDERNALTTAFTKRGTEVTQAAPIFTALGRGVPLGADALASFLGADFSAWILGQPPTPDDCKAIVDHVKSFKDAPNFAPEQFLPLSELVEAWESDGACASRKLTPSAKSCLLSATNIADTNRCAVPISPSIVAFRSRIRGAWRAVDIEASEGPKSKALRRLSLTIDEARLTLAGPDPIAGEASVVWLRDGNVRVIKDAVALAKLKLGNRRVQIALWPPTHVEGRKERLYLSLWDATSGKEKPVVTFERDEEAPIQVAIATTGGIALAVAAAADTATASPSGSVMPPAVPKAPPPAPAKPAASASPYSPSGPKRGNCGCAASDLMCNMRCSSH